MINTIVIVSLVFLLCVTLLGFQVESRNARRLGHTQRQP